MLTESIELPQDGASKFTARAETLEDGTLRFIVSNIVTGAIVADATDPSKLDDFEVALVHAGLDIETISCLSHNARALLRTEIVRAPPGWKDDKLSQFVDQTQIQSRSVFHNSRHWYSHLSRINNIFEAFANALVDPEDAAAPFFFMRAHAAFMSASGLVLGTQLPEAYMVLRGCLEASLYGFKVSANPDTVSVWLNRNTDDDALRASKRAFMLSGTPRKNDPPPIFDLLKAKDAKLAEAAESLYDLTIECGAHPNQMAIVGNMRIQHQDDSVVWSVDYLNPDPNNLGLCFKTAARVGLCSLKIFANVFPKRYFELGLVGRINSLTRDAWITGDGEITHL